MQIMARDDMPKQLLAVGYEPYILDSKDLGRLIVSERVKWDKIIKDAHIAVQ